MNWDDDRPRPRPTIVVGEDLSLLSIGDLEERIAALHAEIARTEAERDAKRARASAADQFFKS